MRAGSRTGSTFAPGQNWRKDGLRGSSGRGAQRIGNCFIGIQFNLMLLLLLGGKIRVANGRGQGGYCLRECGMSGRAR